MQGMRVRPDGPQLISELVRKSVGADCSVLMGANIAQDIGAGQLSEATIGRAFAHVSWHIKPVCELGTFHTHKADTLCEVADQRYTLKAQ